MNKVAGYDAAIIGTGNSRLTEALLLTKSAEWARIVIRLSQHGLYATRMTNHIKPHLYQGR